MLKEPPDILITTPESLYLMLTSQAQELFAGARWCIVDEIHAVAATKRGAHLALTLERLAGAAGQDLQRIGLSATQRPLEEIAKFLVGPRRKCRVVDATSAVDKKLDLQIHVPVESMVEPDAEQSPDLDPLQGQEATRRSIWPAIYPELLKLIQEHTSTIVFVNNRRAAERLALRLNELAADEAQENGTENGAAEPAELEPPKEIARAHHGSLAREERLVVEELLKGGQLPCLVATSSPGAGHRHGCRRPRHPGRVAEVGGSRPAEDRALGSLRGGRVPRPDLPQVPRRPARVCGRGPSACARERSRPRSYPETPWTFWLSRSWPSPPRRRRTSRSPWMSWPTWWPTRTPTPSCPGRCWKTSWTCWPAGIRAPRSRTCARGSSGIGSRARSVPAPAPASWPSSAAARFPIAGCTRSHCPTGAGWASWTRRWSTRPAPARRSCSGRAPGALRRSPAIA